MSEATFRKGLRAAVRGLFEGVLDVGDFDNAMEKTINRNIRQAWKEGALECGIGEDEYSEEEKRALDSFLVNQYEYIPGFTAAIVENSKSEEPNLNVLFSRTNLWVDRYSEAKANGHAMACSDQKARFVLGIVKTMHCGTCKGLNGRVYRYSTWVKYNAVPPHNWNFECRGGCKCSLVTTSDPITKGRFPVRLLQ